MEEKLYMKIFFSFSLDFLLALFLQIKLIYDDGFQDDPDLSASYNSLSQNHSPFPT